jgi:hypothetical protein
LTYLTLSGFDFDPENVVGFTAPLLTHVLLQDAFRLEQTVAFGESLGGSILCPQLNLEEQPVEAYVDNTHTPSGVIIGTVYRATQWRSAAYSSYTPRGTVVPPMRLVRALPVETAAASASAREGVDGSPSLQWRHLELERAEGARYVSLKYMPQCATCKPYFSGGRYAY